jgi:hypothetical protein
MTTETGIAAGRKEVAIGSARMQFVLVGFIQEMGFRLFSFEGVAADRTRTVFTVRADLALSRKYDIRLQELPLLCREVLERRDEADEQLSYTYTEEHMRVWAGDRAAARDAAAQKRRPPHKPTTDKSESTEDLSGGGEDSAAEDHPA